MANATLITQEKKCLTWRIPNFKKIQQSGSEINKQVIYFGTVLNSNDQAVLTVKWKCYLSFKDDQPENEANIGLYFSLIDSPRDLLELHAAVRIQVHNTDPDESFYKNFSFYRDMKSASGWGYSEFIKQNADVPLTQDNTLKIHITVHIANSKLEALTALHESNFLHQLGIQLSKLRQQHLDISSRVTKILSKDGKELTVDRVVLAARSSVFCSMFQSKMLEKKKGVVKVKDIAHKSLAVLLHFCHTGVLSKNWKDEDVIEGLVFGAHKYMLDDLKKFFAQVLGLVCTENNCGKLMSLARTFEMKDAEEQLLEYFKVNLVKNVENVISFAQDAAKIPLYNEEDGPSTE